MKRIFLLVMLLVAMATMFIAIGNGAKKEAGKMENYKSEKAINVLPGNKRTIYLAGGCFWGVEGYFQRINGVVDTDTGYANGKTKKTNYEQIHATDHAETVKIDYD